MKIESYFFQKCNSNLMFYFIGDPRRVFNFNPSNNVRLSYTPSGLTIDRDGYLYAAMFNKSEIAVIDPKYISLNLFNFIHYMYKY